MFQNSLKNRIGDADTSVRLQLKLKSLTPQRKKQMFQKIVERRRSENYDRINGIKKQQDKVCELIENKRLLSERLMQYSSKVLQGQALRSFNESIHFSFQKERQSQHSNQRQQLECSICIQAFLEQELASRPFRCVHIFHTACIEQLYSTTPKASCPNCRNTSTHKETLLHLQEFDQLAAKMNSILQKEAFLAQKFSKYLLQ